jgi:glutathione S-transferase
MGYRLHYFPESGNSYKLALMLSLCGQAFEPVWTDFGGGVTRTAEWRAKVNAMGEIPVLEDDGIRLTQTAPILLRLAERYGRLGGSNDEERFEILRWLFWDNHKLTATWRPIASSAPSRRRPIPSCSISFAGVSTTSSASSTRISATARSWSATGRPWPMCR